MLTTGGADGGTARPVGIQAIAATGGAKPDFPVDHVVNGWTLSPVIAELGVRVLTPPRCRTARGRD